MGGKDAPSNSAKETVLTKVFLADAKFHCPFKTR